MLDDKLYKMGELQKIVQRRRLHHKQHQDEKIKELAISSARFHHRRSAVIGVRMV